MKTCFITVNTKALFSVCWPSHCTVWAVAVSRCIYAKKYIFGLSLFYYDYYACFNTQGGKYELSLFVAIYHLSVNCLYSALPLPSLTFELFHWVSFWCLKNGAKHRRQRHQALMSCCCCCCRFWAHHCFAYLYRKPQQGNWPLSSYAPGVSSKLTSELTVTMSRITSGWRR